jgi:hypothetical protein
VMFGVPIAAIIACITVVGLLIGVSTIFLWLGALGFAQVVVGGLVGQWLLGRSSEAWPVIGRMVLGVLLLRVCTVVPHIGGWVKFAIIVWGLGAISLAIYRRFHPILKSGEPVPTPFAPPPLPHNTTVGGIQPL